MLRNKRTNIKAVSYEDNAAQRYEKQRNFFQNFFFHFLSPWSIYPGVRDSHMMQACMMIDGWPNQVILRIKCCTPLHTMYVLSHGKCVYSDINFSFTTCFYAGVCDAVVRSNGHKA